MTVSSVSQSQSTYDPSAMQAQFKQRRQDFQSLQGALQSGDLASAQQAFAALQKDAPGAKGPNPKGNSQMSQDFQTLQSALQSGDLSGAEKAFASIQQEIKGAKGTHHHHHRQGSAAAQSPATDPNASTAAPVSGSGLNVQA